MFERFLLPVDLSDKGSRAVAACRRIADRGEVILLHVIETIDDVEQSELKEFYERLEEKARRRMAELAEEASGGGFAVRQEVTYGKRAREIVRFAASEEVDLIVLGSHRVDPEEPGDDWMSLSYQVAILAQGPVLLAK